MLRAEQIMSDNLMTVTPDCSLLQAIDILLEGHISGLPVVDHQGNLVGIVSEFALLAIAYDAAVLDQPVGDHMTRDVVCVEADEPINKIADLCIVHRVRRLPVLKEGRLVGLISRRDVLKAVYNKQRAVAAS